MNSERLAWLNWAALATTEPNLLWAGYFFCMGFYSGIFSDPAGSFFCIGFYSGIFSDPVSDPAGFFFVWVFTVGSFPVPF